MSVRRGQTMLLILGLLFLLTVLVCLTLSLSRMTKKKMELQVAADAAAYSQAVAVARTYNAVALLNRTQSGKLVASLGVESAISFAGAYVGALAIAQDNLFPCTKRELGCYPTAHGWLPPPCPPAFAQIVPPDQALRAELGRIWGQWRQLDTLAGAQARTLNVHARILGDDETSAMMALREQTVRTGALGARVALFSNPDLTPNLEPVWLDLRELDLATTEEERRGSLNAVAGSRVHEFIVNRAGAEGALNAALRRLLGGTVAARTALSEFKGISYYHRTKVQNAETSEHAAWAEEGGHLTVDLAFRGGVPPVSCRYEAGAYVKSVAGTAGNEHVYGAGADPDPNVRHRLPGGGHVWPITWDVNPDVLTDVADRFGQPKQLVAFNVPLAPGVGAAADPWNLLFRFRMQPGSAGTQLDLQTLRLRGGEDLSTPLAVSTGIAYYHRTGHFKEPPNLLNPFWRATLIHADVDATGAADFQRLLVGGAPPHAAESLSELRRAGYRALP